MKGSPLQQLDQRLRHSLPVLLNLSLILVNATPTHLPGFAIIAPVLPLIGIYYWSVFRSDLLGPATAFALGLVQDIVVGMPLGVSSLIYLLVQVVSSAQRKFFLGKPFLIAWWGFAFIAAGALALQWGFMAVFFAKRVALVSVAYEFLLTVLAYPILCWMFARLQLALLSRV